MAPKNKEFSTENPLYWMPFPWEKWHEIVDTMTRAQTLATLQLLELAWKNRGILPASEEILAKGAGLSDDEWTRIGGPVRALFVTDPGQPGMLRWPWVFGLFAAQLAKHESAVTKGKMGGRPTKEEAEAKKKHQPKSRRKSPKKAEVLAEDSPGVSPQLDAQPKPGVKSNETELELQGFSLLQREKDPAAASSRSPDGARRSGTSERRPAEVHSRIPSIDDPERRRTGPASKHPIALADLTGPALVRLEPELVTLLAARVEAEQGAEHSSHLQHHRQEAVC
jgi:uncharacterized protein YdaU (DUF1376 family)